ncbi:uncharacterized protein LOC9644044 [Selaginella moellendorffii]|uniref:uncharacterized protein LOC9644044 n=1 Tax=Selaginella moellendorffii TaxID=88036 RepID=UPI000D1C7667|nr:uncharacterized protein LOC9644044 [Selaginella moellendorffii]|eukprot:XP_024545162.1 uncharacterized protein LOC9644044 [Selaginella moellendorffii]
MEGIGNAVWTGALLVLLALVAKLWRSIVTRFWLEPRSLDARIRSQGIQGPPRTFIAGNMLQVMTMRDTGKERDMEGRRCEACVAGLPPVERGIATGGRRSPGSSPSSSEKFYAGERYNVMECDMPGGGGGQSSIRENTRERPRLVHLDAPISRPRASSSRLPHRAPACAERTSTRIHTLQARTSCWIIPSNISRASTFLEARMKACSIELELLKQLPRFLQEPHLRASPILRARNHGIPNNDASPWHCGEICLALWICPVWCIRSDHHGVGGLVVIRHEIPEECHCLFDPAT